MTLFRRRAALLSAAAFLVLTAAPAYAADADARFTIAVIPDTQNYVDYTHQTAEKFPFDASKLFLDQMQYIAQNTESQGGEIAFVTAVGDIWQHQSLSMDPGHEARGLKRVPNRIMDSHFAPTPKVRSFEMPMAKKGYDLIAGKVPFSVVPGNHDYDAMWTDANHPPAPVFTDMASLGMLHPGGLSNFRAVFSDQSDYFKGKSWYVDSHDGGADSAQVFTAGGYRFLHIGLQFDAPDASLAWASEVIKRHPDLPTIVTTHNFLDTSGQRLSNPMIDSQKVDPMDNNPQMVWDKFISQHDQIFLVLCGHQHAQAFRTDPNVAGHKVYQVLADYQARGQTAKDAGRTLQQGEGVGDGWLRLMTFDMSKPTPRIEVSTYSTHYEKFSKDTAQYVAWYKADEQPKMTDAQFREADHFTIDLTDFRARFDATARISK